MSRVPANGGYKVEPQRPFTEAGMTGHMGMFEVKG
jgi:hypothetical protein